MDRETFLKTGAYFLGLVRLGAEKNRRKSLFPKKPDGVKWTDIFYLSEKHSLSAVTFRALESADEKPEGEVWEKWERAYRVCVHADIQQLFAWDELKEDFSEKGINVLPLKGLRIKKLYPETVLRLMGDLDILYRKSQFFEVKNGLQALGYTYKKESAGGHHQIFERPPVTHVEMHRALLPDESPFAEYYADPWQRALPTDEESVYRFSPEDEYIFMLMHGYKHFSGAGSGVRTMLDFYLFLKAYGDTLNREYIDGEIAAADALAEKRGAEGAPLKNFEATLFRKIGLWFEGESAVLDETGLEILSDGVYGRAEKRWIKESRKKGRGKYLFGRLFPPFRTMKQAFPVLKKLPFLLPFFWIWRILRGVFKRRKNIAREVRCVNEEFRKEEK